MSNLKDGQLMPGLLFEVGGDDEPQYTEVEQEDRNAVSRPSTTAEDEG